MAHTIITLNSRFTLEFKIKRDNLKKIEEVLNVNGLTHTTWQQTGFPAFYSFRVDCNLRQAELARQLLKNFKLYD